MSKTLSVFLLSILVLQSCAKKKENKHDKSTQDDSKEDSRHHRGHQGHDMGDFGDFADFLKEGTMLIIGNNNHLVWKFETKIRENEDDDHQELDATKDSDRF